MIIIFGGLTTLILIALILKGLDRINATLVQIRDSLDAGKGRQ